MNDAAKPTLTVICPVHNEEQAVPLFHARFRDAVAALGETCAVELVFTNNGSSDGTLAAIHALMEDDPTIQVITLSRNFGYQASLLCGLTHARGDAIVVIDVDCEDPPEMIPRFVEAWQGGADVVYGLRRSRPEPAALQLLRKAFYRLTRAIADDDFIVDMAEFSLITRRVRDSVVATRTSFPFVRNEIAVAGFRRHAIPYSREPRICGRSHYNLLSLTRFALNGILTASTFPLRLAVYLGVPLMVANLAGLAAFWAGPAVGVVETLAILDLTYLVLVACAVSIYVARTYRNSLGRPVFIVDWDETHLLGR